MLFGSFKNACNYNINLNGHRVPFGDGQRVGNIDPQAGPVQGLRYGGKTSVRGPNAQVVALGQEAVPQPESNSETGDSQEGRQDKVSQLHRKSCEIAQNWPTLHVLILN